MRCDEARLHLAAAVPGEPASPELEAARGHASSCAACASAARDFERVHRSVPSAVLPEDDDFWSRQRASALSRLPARSRWRAALNEVGRSRWAWGPVLAGAFALTIWFWPAPPSSPRAAVEPGVVQDLDFIQQMDFLDHMDMLEHLDELETPS
jgi:hypothetical protein